MPRGGPRPGAGRKPLSEAEKARARAGRAAKRRPGASKGKAPTRTSVKPKKAAPPARSARPAVDAVETPPEQLDPLSYMLKVMNNPRATPERRDRMAVAAAPFVHGKVAEKGKKDQRQAGAQVASQGKFSSAAPPRSPRVN